MGEKGKQKITVAMAGNPNVGKSTLFNSLTGLRQHTGNWPGKTVSVARGHLETEEDIFEFVDLPGTYALQGDSEDEEIASQYITSDEPDCTVIVCDATCLERSLLLAMDILQIPTPAIICINLMDEADKRGIKIDKLKIAEYLQVPIVYTSVRKKESYKEMLPAIRQAIRMKDLKRSYSWKNAIDGTEYIMKECLSSPSGESKKRLLIDRLFINRFFGIPLMFLLLLLVIWLTVWGANYPSAMLERGFDALYKKLIIWLNWAPSWVSGILVDGIYSTCARVIAVMLPPMAIFFPLFTLLEDIGYLPRMAFLLDKSMCRCGGCGKQALTLCMGLGCNAVGIMGCRIIHSPKERLIAILTNAFIPCNGRFPTLILLGSLFFPRAGAAFIVAICVVLGVVAVMGVSWLLNKSLCRNQPSAFVMEIPPFRRPRLGQILIRSLLDRTVFVAGRALAVAAPAGIVFWILSETGAMDAVISFLNPLGLVLGMNGAILLAFLLALPANELIIPVMLMGFAGVQSLQETIGLTEQVLLNGGFTWQMGICTMVFTLFHWPCSTTLLTIQKETGSFSKTALAAFLPTACGALLCLMLHWVLQ